MATDSKSEYVFDQLRQEILTGALAPGESLSAVNVGTRFGASRTPVRQAFLRLESEGLVSLIDRQGARVSPISIKSVRDLFELRTLLESTAARMVAEAAGNNPNVHNRFRQLLDDFEQVSGQEPSQRRHKRFYELTEQYDQAIVDSTRNEHLARSIADLRPHTTRLRFIAHARPEHLDVSLSEHLGMCRAILAHDAAAAARACADHLAETRQTILATVLDPGDSTVLVDLVGT